MVLLIDNYDSFTYNLYQYYLQAGVVCEVVSNDKVQRHALERKDLKLVVISPGPGGPEATGRCLDVIAGLQGKVPMFGVCLGLQTLAVSAGARIVQAAEPVHGKLSRITHDGGGVFQGLPSPLQVTRYHSLVVDPLSVPAGWTISARTTGGEIMGMRHEGLRLEGVQFHPEALLTESGQAIVENSLKL